MTARMYAHWGEVPEHLHTRAQLERLEFPRLLAEDAQPAAWVATTDWRGRDDRLALYEVSQSQPTAATVGQLAAAARRSDRVRTCRGCDAYCERVLGRTGGRKAPLCRACGHIGRLRARQAELAERRREVERRAAEQLGEGLAAVCARRIRPPRPEGGRLPAAVAVVLEAAAAGGATGEGVVRLAGARNPHVPAGAASVAEAGPHLVELLAGRVVAVWGEEDAAALQALDGRLGRAGLLAQDAGLGVHTWQVGGEIAVWRGELTPSYGLVPAVNPGRAERLLVLLERIAAAHDGAAERAAAGA